MSNGAGGRQAGMINLLRRPACFGITVGKIFLADGLIQRRTNSVEIGLEDVVFRLSEAHLIWVSGVIRFCIPPGDDFALGRSNRVTL